MGVCPRSAGRGFAALSAVGVACLALPRSGLPGPVFAFSHPPFWVCAASCYACPPFVFGWHAWHVPIAVTRSQGEGFRNI